MLWLLLLVVLAASVGLAGPAAPNVPEAAQASANFEAETATNAWLATVAPADKAKSDAYFEGGYWLILWDFLCGAVVFLLVLETRLSARMRDWAERRTTRRWLQSFLYTLALTLFCALVTFPLSVYEGFLREHQYGLSSQTFSAWLGDQMIGLCLGLMVSGAGGVIFLAILRRFPNTWQWWATGVAVLAIIVGFLLTPVFIEPLFNTYTPLGDQKIKQQILSLARANGIPARNVYQVDASRQSKRVSANVAGLFGSERITLNDNLLNRCSPQAIQSVMGHEMGHYVLHHLYNGVLFSAVCVAIAVFVLRKLLETTLQRWGGHWEIRSLADPAVLPLVVLIMSTIGFLATPISNTFTRTQEYEADIFGLDAARQPDGEAEVDLLLGEYRKLDPSPLEEFIFFDHPSGRTRIYAAMRWKAENLCLFDAKLACANRPLSVAAVPTGH